MIILIRFDILIPIWSVLLIMFYCYLIFDSIVIIRVDELGACMYYNHRYLLMKYEVSMETAVTTT